MKPSEFHIGLEFICGPFWWRCTDVGTRTVNAIRLIEEDPVWYQGPPYMVEEVVLDEAELEGAHLTEEAQILASIHNHHTTRHPGFPHEAVSRMMDEKLDGERYPRKRLFQFDRVRADGEILHPYAGRKDGSAWLIQLYLPFTKEWTEIGEVEFLALPLSTPDAVRRRADSCRASVNNISHSLGAVHAIVLGLAANACPARRRRRQSVRIPSEIPSRRLCVAGLQ